MSKSVPTPFTADEWDHPHDILDGYVSLEVGGIVDVRLGGPAADGERDRQMLAALVLHGQPFGFSWEDVDGLLSDAAALEFEGGSAVVTRSVADRLAALLPPREG